MPIVIETEETRVVQLEELIERLDRDLDTRCHDSMAAAASDLKALANNRTFLADVVARELKDLATMQRGNTYTPQVVMLHLNPCKNYFLRANIWPSSDEHMVRASGGAAFVYGLPHDHNFDFLTFGYFGPGYWSDYWEYDYEAVAGAVGEKAGLRFVERSRLEPGKLMHYRAHRDVHSQLPPDALSVSLNVMHAGGAQGCLDQYRFDIEKDEIAAVLSPGASEVFLRIAVGFGCEESRDLAERFARSHPSDRTRLAALEAQAGVLELVDRDELWRRAEGAGSRLVAIEARRWRETLAGA